MSHTLLRAHLLDGVSQELVARPISCMEVDRGACKGQIHGVAVVGVLYVEGWMLLQRLHCLKVAGQVATGLDKNKHTTELMSAYIAEPRR